MQLQLGDERYITADGQLKTPLSLTVLLLFFLRGYVAWILSLSFFEDRSLILQFFYTNTHQFALALAVGLPALLLFVLTTQVKTEIAAWVSKAFRWAPLLLWLSWVLDGILLLSLIGARWPAFSWVKAMLLFGWLMGCWLLLFSRHLKRYFQLVRTAQEE